MAKKKRHPIELVNTRQLVVDAYLEGLRKGSVSTAANLRQEADQSRLSYELYFLLQLEATKSEYFYSHIEMTERVLIVAQAKEMGLGEEMAYILEQDDVY